RPLRSSRERGPGTLSLESLGVRTPMVAGYRVPMSAPDITPEDIALVTRALESRILSLGPFLDQLETAFAAYVGSRHAIGVTNGTSGLHLCMRAAGIADGDE